MRPQAPSWHRKMMKLNEHPFPNGQIRHVVMVLPDGSIAAMECMLKTAYTVQGIINEYGVLPVKQAERELFPAWSLSAFSGVRVGKNLVFKDPEKAAKAAFLMSLKRKG